MTRLRKRRRRAGLARPCSFSIAASGKCSRADRAKNPLTNTFDAVLKTDTSRLPHDGDRLLRTNPSTAGSDARNRRPNAFIFRVSPRPVAGCTSLSFPWSETMRIGARGTPSPIAVSGQTGMNLTRALSRLTPGQETTLPSYRQRRPSRHLLTTTTGRACATSVASPARVRRVRFAAQFLPDGLDVQPVRIQVGFQTRRGRET